MNDLRTQKPERIARSRPCLARPFLLAALVAAVGAAAEPAALASSRSRPEAVGAEERPTLVFVPGVTGSRLETSSGRTLWGSGGRLLWPRDRGHEIALAIGTGTDRDDRDESDPAIATGALLTIRLAMIKKQVYRPLLESLVEAGYRQGDPLKPSADADLYFFAYDWRRDNVEVAGQLHDFLERVSAARSNRRVDLACQSNAGRICRYLVRYGSSSLDEAEARAAAPPDARSSLERTYRVEKLLLIGASNGGSLRQLHELNRGRRYVPLVGRFLAQETLFTIRPLFSDLPSGRSDLFLDAEGRVLHVDLFDVENWKRFGWSVFAPKLERRLGRRRLAKRLERLELASSASRVEYLRQRLGIARREHQLLDSLAGDLQGVGYFLLENQSSSTPDRAVLIETKNKKKRKKKKRPEAGARWKTLFANDRKVRRNPHLRARTSAPGDGHATLASQNSLSPPEQRAIRGRFRVSGGHFETIVEPATLEIIVGILLPAPQ